MYWPDELPPPKKPAPDQVSPQSGRRTYHGSHELIASSYLDVLDVLSFAGKADIGHWLEEDDNLMHKLYWRQTFCRETQELSVSTSALCLWSGLYLTYRRNSENIACATAISTPRLQWKSARTPTVKSGSMNNV
jgi:hypothetical protein